MSDRSAGSVQGRRRLQQTSAAFRNASDIDPITVRELLHWFGAEHRGVRVNRTIRDALFETNLRIEPDLNEGSIDSRIAFREGVLTDEIDEQFFKTNRVFRPGHRLDKIEAAMLNKIYVELFSDSLAGWIDRNPSATEHDIRAKADALRALGLEELAVEEGAEVLAFPTPAPHIGRLPWSQISLPTSTPPDAGISSGTALVLTVRYGTRRTTPAEMEEERRSQHRLCVAIGHFIFEFSQLEFLLRYALQLAVGLSDEKFRVLGTSYDFASLCKITEEFFLRFVEGTQDEQNKIKTLTKNCLSVNNDRIRIAHGTWFIDEAGPGAQHVTRGSFQPRVHYEKIEELERITEKVEDLKSDVSQILIWPLRC